MGETRKTCVVTGHRPTRFKFKYSEDYTLCKKIKKALMEEFKRMCDEEGMRRVWVDGALGVDMWAGEIALRIKACPNSRNLSFELAFFARATLKSAPRSDMSIESVFAN